MRLSSAPFFCPGAGNLVALPDPDDWTLACYSLADYYHQNPAVFLDMPLSEVAEHSHFTRRLNERRKEKASEDDDG